MNRAGQILLGDSIAHRRRNQIPPTTGREDFGDMKTIWKKHFLPGNTMQVLDAEDVKD